MATTRVIQIDALSDDAEQRDLFEQANAVHTAAGEAVFGDQHTGWTVDELRGKRRGAAYRYTDLAAIADEKVVGMVAVSEPQHDNLEMANLMLAVHPDHRRAGVGRELVAAAERIAHEHGRRVVTADTQWADDGEDESGLFAKEFGYASAQTVIRSAMALPADRGRLQIWADGDDIEDAAAFELEASWGGVPDGWLPDLAVMEQRMSTDAPQGDLAVQEEKWDGERVRSELQWALDAGRRIVTVVARDLSIGRLVGFTQIHVSPGSPDLGYQQDTLVLREARGNQLGIRLKARAALEVMDELPGVTRVRTWNADDNAHMLAVNADLGYIREGNLREWQKRLDG